MPWACSSPRFYRCQRTSIQKCISPCAIWNNSWIGETVGENGTPELPPAAVGQVRSAVTVSSRDATIRSMQDLALQGPRRPPAVSSDQGCAGEQLSDVKELEPQVAQRARVAMPRARSRGRAWPPRSRAAGAAAAAGGVAWPSGADEQMLGRRGPGSVDAQRRDRPLNRRRRSAIEGFLQSASAPWPVELKHNQSTSQGSP